MSYHGWRTCVSWLSHTSTNTTFLSKASDYFSHMLLQRWEAKIRRKGSSPQPGIKLTTTRSRVQHTHQWATRAGLLQRTGKLLYPAKLNLFPHNDTFWPLGNKPFENTVGKGEIARNEQFLLFPQCFLPLWITFFHFRQTWNCRLQTHRVWKSLKFVVW